MKKATLTVVIAAVAAFSVFSQDKSEPNASTKLEAFDTKAGTVIVEGFSTIGSVKGRYGSTVEITSKEFTDASTGAKEYGITVALKEPGREHISYVDFDEIDPLIKGIDYLAKVDKSATKLDSFQADYRTKSDLDLSTYLEDGGKVQASIKSGSFSAPIVFLTLDDLAQIKSLILKAKAKLDAIKK